MKIGSSFEPRRTADQVRTRSEGSRESQSTQGSGAGSQVRLSDLSTRLADLEARISETDAFDQKRVDEIKQAIADGRFKVNSGAVADKLIENVREMLGGKVGPTG